MKTRERDVLAPLPVPTAPPHPKRIGDQVSLEPEPEGEEDPHRWKGRVALWAAEWAITSANRPGGTFPIEMDEDEGRPTSWIEKRGGYEPYSRGEPDV